MATPAHLIALVAESELREQEQLIQTILKSRKRFSGARGARSRALLEYFFVRHRDGATRITQRELAEQFFPDIELGYDSVVRKAVGRLAKILKSYFLGEGITHKKRARITTGRYRLEFYEVRRAGLRDPFGWFWGPYVDHGKPVAFTIGTPLNTYEEGFSGDRGRDGNPLLDLHLMASLALWAIFMHRRGVRVGHVGWEGGFLDADQKGPDQNVIMFAGPDKNADLEHFLPLAGRLEFELARARGGLSAVVNHGKAGWLKKVDTLKDPKDGRLKTYTLLTRFPIRTASGGRRFITILRSAESSMLRQGMNVFFMWDTLFRDLRAMRGFDRPQIPSKFQLVIEKAVELPSFSPKGLQMELTIVATRVYKEVT
jgi:hypothetical protein